MPDNDKTKQLGAGCFQKLGVLFGVQIIRAVVCWGLDWGPLTLGNYHLRRYEEIVEVP